MRGGLDPDLPTSRAVAGTLSLPPACPQILLASLWPARLGQARVALAAWPGRRWVARAGAGAAGAGAGAGAGPASPSAFDVAMS